MNKKTNTDKDLLEHIERVIHEGEISDIELINVLAQTRPPMNPSLHDDLEVDLLARLREKQAKTQADIMKRKNGKIKAIPKRFASIPFTLVVATLALMIMGGMILFIQRSLSESLGSTVKDADQPYMITPTAFVPDFTATNVCTVRIAHSYASLYGAASIFATEILRLDSGTELLVLEETVNPTSVTDAIWYRVRLSIEDGWIEGYILADMATQKDCTSVSTGKRIGIVVGHQGGTEDRGAVCEDGFSELEVNQGIADVLATEMLNSGYAVDIFNEFDTGLRDYEADLLIALHTGDCNGTFLSGYSYASSVIDIAILQECFSKEYVAATGLQPISASPDIRDSYLSRMVDAATPVLMLEMGRLAADRVLLTEERQQVVTGILNTISCLL